jgi:hypothetical protein
MVGRRSNPKNSQYPTDTRMKVMLKEFEFL